MSLIDTIDRETMSDEQIRDIYQQHWNNRQTQMEMNLTWYKSRIKKLGYKSNADFIRRNPSIRVTAGTVTNYFRGYSTMPIYQMKDLCYALCVTPDTLLMVMGYYDPSKQQIIDL